MQTSMTVLGIHYETHDTGAAIITDGTVRSAIAEERLSRVKEDGSFPTRSISAVLSESNLTYKDLTHIAVSGEQRLLPYLRDQAAYKYRPFLFALPTLVRTGQFRTILASLKSESGIRVALNAYKKRRQLHAWLQEATNAGFTGKVFFTGHDEAHAAAAYASSGYTDALIPIYEGYSMKNASSIWEVKNGTLRRLHEIAWPHSPGQFYRCVTQVLGFSPRRHAGKITGLAAYGDPAVAGDTIAALFRFDADKESLCINPTLYTYQYHYQTNNAIPDDLSSFSREDLAASFQTVLEKSLTDMTNHWLQKTGHTHVTMAGGVVANVKVNQRIAALPMVERIHVHPAMSDAGQALGAAYAVWIQESKPQSITPIQHVYYGPTIDTKSATAALEHSDLSYTQPERLAAEVATLLANKKVVAVAQGRMEYGPRALGSRTIMYAPTDSAVNDWLNKQLNRTEFMPFAPVTLKEEAHRCYDTSILDKAADALPFMTISVDCTPYMQETQPAVVHVDNTARPQLITRKQNELYYDILRSYCDQTGIPSLVNTSFNMHEEPIVCSAEDALRSFIASNIDYLVLGPYLISRQEAS